MTRHRWLIVAQALSAMLIWTQSRPATAAFSDVTTAAGISYFFDPKPVNQIPLLEFQTGGAAAGDYDNDGWVDLYVTRYFAPDILYRNNGNGTFSDVTTAAFGALPTRNTNGAGWADIDNDGDLDMYVASVNQLQHFLYINDGAGHFTDQAVTRGAAVGDGVRTTAGTSVSFGDYDNDGWLDIYVGEWLLDQSVPVQARLLRNLGPANPGHFVDVTNAAGVNMDLTTGDAAGKSFSFTPRFTDLDRDGHQDIAVASDGHTSRLFWNNGDGTFADGSNAMDATFGSEDMGFAVGDVSGDGLLDVFISDVFISGFAPDGNRLLINNGDRTFTDTTTAAGVRGAGWGWGTEMFDYNNDGDLDLIVTNGYYDPPAPADRVRFFENNYQNAGEGVFTERAIVNGITNIAQGRGLLTFDYDKDGDTDVFIVNNHQAPVLYRNNGGYGNNWLDIKTVGTLSNPEGIGAFITVTPDLDNPTDTLVWEMTGSSTFLAQSEKLAHFGLEASASIVDLIQIEWPTSGIVQQLTNISTNQLLTIIEPLPDYNSDGIIDSADYVVWRRFSGSSVAPGTSGDGNGDGLVNDQDYNLWRRSYSMIVHPGGAGADTGTTSIPEPATTDLLGLALLVLQIWRAKRSPAPHIMQHGRHWRIVTLALAATLAFAEPHQAAAATFSNVTMVAGINYFYDPKPHHQDIPLPEFMTGGAAAGDYDNDGWVDLYVTRHYAPDILYRNNGNGTFSDATGVAFGVLPTRSTSGAGWGDIDNDGDLDLYVSSAAGSEVPAADRRHFLYVNDGAGHFTEEASLRGAAVGDGVRTTAGMSVSFGDYDNDGWLDIYVGEWADNSVPVQARLLRNLGTANPGHFADTTNAAGVNMDITEGPAAYASLSFTPRFADFDRDGYQDIAVVSDIHTTRMFWNNGDGTFSDGTSTMGVTTGNADMGFAVGDVNRDGLLDWFNTDIYIPPEHVGGNRLFINNGDRTFTDTTTAAGVQAAGWGWGAEMLDYNNDGDLDIIATNGYYYPPAPPDRVRFFENNDQNNGIGVFTERAIPLGITDIAQGRGLLTFDYDRDGDTDIFIVNNHQAPVLYRNNGGNANDWLNIETVGTLSNADGIGAFITVTPDLDNPSETLVWEVTGSSTFLAQSEKLAHFGLGLNAGNVDLVRIEWPASGIVQQLANIAPNQRLSVVEPLPDYNANGIVDAADYVIWRKFFGASVTPGTSGDGNGDGDVNDLDYQLWRRAYGMVVDAGSGSSAGGPVAAPAVPEPSARSLFALTLLALVASQNPGRRFRPLP